MKTEDIKLFHQIANCGGLNNACKMLSLSKSNVSRRIKRLELELNFQLFERHNGAMQVSHAGSMFYDKTKTILQTFETDLREISAPNDEVAGQLRIQLLALPMILDISRVILRFMDIYPKVQIEILSSSEDKNLIEHNIDVALRIGEKLQDSSLIARPLGFTSFGFYCTQQYIDNHGMPVTAEDLHNHNVIRFRFPSGQIYSRVPFSKTQTVDVSGNLITNSAGLMLEACVQNRGIIFIPEQITENCTKKAQLVRLFSHVEPSLNYAWLVYPYRKHLSLAARTFIEYMLSEVKKYNELQCHH